MAHLTESEVRQLQILLGLTADQLLPNSQLRHCVKTVENNDLQFGLSVVDDIKTNLLAIAEIDLKIDDIKVDNIDALKRKNIYQEYEVEYEQGKDAASGLKERRAKLINRLYQDLNLYRNQHSGRKLRS